MNAVQAIVDDPITSSLDSRIADAEELINKLVEAEESADQQMKDISGEIEKLHRKGLGLSYEGKKLQQHMEQLQNSIGWIDKVSHHSYSNKCLDLTRPCPMTAKELAEPIQKQRFQVRHIKNHSLAEERDNSAASTA